jgi:hypothetical protein
MRRPAVGGDVPIGTLYSVGRIAMVRTNKGPKDTEDTYITRIETSARRSTWAINGSSMEDGLSELFDSPRLVTAQSKLPHLETPLYNVIFSAIQRCGVNSTLLETGHTPRANRTPPFPTRIVPRFRDQPNSICALKRAESLPSRCKARLQASVWEFGICRQGS